MRGCGGRIPPSSLERAKRDVSPCGNDTVRTMTLPPTIADFFRMKNAREDEGLWMLFASHAVVIDGGEGTEMRGTDEIKNGLKRRSLASIFIPRFGRMRSAMASGGAIAEQG